jgi:predicted nucleotide-binding protein (sugar kinase/HSP70/actin superfamily)
VPQIDFLPVEGESVGRTCTTNQGGILIAHHFAKMRYPDARFKLFDISLNKTDPQYIVDQLYNEFQSIFDYYLVNVSKSKFIEAITYAEKEYKRLQAETVEITADIVEQAINKKINISIINAREYILNPGIYDSHIGKLLKDRGVLAIPTYVFDIYPDKQFDFIYWKNPHDLMTKVNAIANKRLHRIIKHSRLRKLIKQIETGNAQILMSVVTVSTFRCGPDSITLPILAEITKNIPSLLIQSDAMITELAHLENRVNTHLNQLNKRLHNELSRKKETNLSIEFLTEFSLDGLHKETDVIYFPTASDNRAITSVFKAAGLTVIDNYDDESFDLEEKAKIGRKYVGDSVCVPLAAVFADMLYAVDDFIQRKAADDPLVSGAERIVLFMHSGDGPCRQGLYVNICKLNFYRMLSDSVNQIIDQSNGHHPIKFLENIATSLHNKRDFLSEIENWTTIQAFHALTVKGVLHSIYLKATSNCKNYEEFERFKLDYKKLKHDVYNILENNVKPGRFSQIIVDKMEQRIPKLSGLAQYFGYGLYYNNGLRKIFKKFGNKWIRNHGNEANLTNKKINIHVEGEVYLRVAQIEEIQKFLIDTLGFSSFDLTYTPMWSFFEYILESRILIANKDIEIYRNKIEDDYGDGEKNKLENSIEEKKDSIIATSKTINNLRNVLAGPLYKAAGIEIPEEMKKAIIAAKPVLPKYKPFGELVPYVGETISQLNNGKNLVLNVAPEGCMVASMGEMLSPKMMQFIDDKRARIQHLFTTECEINEELMQLSLLKILGSVKYYSE